MISLSYVAIYYEMIQAHEMAHQKAFQYFGINSTIVFYSPFEAKTIPQNYNLSTEDSKFLYFIQSLNEAFEYQFVTLIAFVFLSMLAIITAIFILVADGKRKEEI
jgi:hypothetical protein